MMTRAFTWWTILRIALEERLAYRGDFWLGTLMRFLPIVTQVFLWGAVFAGMGAAASNGQIAGFSYHDMIAYYLIAMIGRAFSSMPGLASGIARQIRDGEIKKYLIQPVDLIGVDPPYRGRGVARTLLRRFVDSGRELRAIEKVATLIDLGQSDVREFFTRVGFHHGPMVQMERSIEP